MGKIVIDSIYSGSRQGGGKIGFMLRIAPHFLRLDYGFDNELVRLCDG